METFTFFWHGPFSQWHECRFTIDAEVYNCAEQYMMAGKAKLFNDHTSFNAIMTAKTPDAQKKLGRKVQGFDLQVWEQHAREIVYKGNEAKFTQNPVLYQELMKTKGTTLVEASPYDRVWGIGLAADDARAKHRTEWQGLNWLGETLTKLREDFSRGNY